jgi:predicted anti-sigma-YlaC factor YlaD
VSRFKTIIVLLSTALLLSGCSFKRMAVNKVGDALAAGGTTFSSDDDPELIKQAVPFSLKLMESLLAESPDHKGLLLATSSGFTQYGYAFIQQDADEIESEDYAAAEAMRDRARRMYLRARGYGLRGLEAAHPGFTNALWTSPQPAVARMKKKDVPQLYWTAAAWGAAIALGKDDPAAIGEIPQMEALIDRALQLDESWGDGAIHGFLINFEMSRQGVAGSPVDRARQHFERAVELTQGKQAGPFVTYAEAVCVEQQDAKQFEELLQRALSLNPDEHPDSRLVNLIMQRRARWLLSKEQDLFLNLPASTGK